MIKPETRLPPLNGLRAFDAAGRHLNFRIAAEELGVTQGAVAQHVRGLESYLGLKLLDRLPRTLALTDNGQRYHAEISRAFTIIGNATQTLQPQSTHLTISVTPTFAAKWLIPRLTDFTAENPQIEFADCGNGKRHQTFHFRRCWIWRLRQTNSIFRGRAKCPNCYLNGKSFPVCSPGALGQI